MRLIHYSRKTVTNINPVVAQPGKYGKPNGLWVSVESSNLSWKDWWEREGFPLDWFDYQYRVKLCKKHRVLIINSEQEFLQFCSEFENTGQINWAVVANRYDGIIIARYFSQFRLSSHDWYYGWDCASGCIWNQDSIESIVCTRKN
jgi:hypothetical protein